MSLNGRGSEGSVSRVDRVQSSCPVFQHVAALRCTLFPPLRVAVCCVSPYRPSLRLCVLCDASFRSPPRFLCMVPRVPCCIRRWVRHAGLRPSSVIASACVPLMSHPAPRRLPICHFLLVRASSVPACVPAYFSGRSVSHWLNLRDCVQPISIFLVS